MGADAPTPPHVMNCRRLEGRPAAAFNYWFLKPAMVRSAKERP